MTSDRTRTCQVVLKKSCIQKWNTIFLKFEFQQDAGDRIHQRTYISRTNQTPSLTYSLLTTHALFLHKRTQ
jgi:hypothetical protein